MTESRRLCLLRILERLAQYRTNSSVLHEGAMHMGNHCTRDQVETDLAWLEEQGLVVLETVESVTIATATPRGIDAALGLATVPGVKRPSPR